MIAIMIRSVTALIGTLFFASLGPASSGMSSPQTAPPQRAHLDVLFINGTVIDGSGGDRYQADVGILGEKIEVIGQNLRERYDADEIIDIKEKFIAPGYIDVHTHTTGTAMGTDQRAKAALNLLYQGITTVNIGADGRHSTKYADQMVGQISKQLDFVDANGFGMNVFVGMGHDNIRTAVMGKDNYRRFSTEAEWREMAKYVQGYMKEGALGMTMGLEYEVGRWSDVEELVVLGKALAAYDKRAVIITHERATGAQSRYYLPSEHNEIGLYGDRFKKYPNGWSVIDYVKDGIRVAEESGVVWDFSHFKITGESYWGKSTEVIGLIDAARARGAKVVAEVIPFPNSGNSPMNLDMIPRKYFGYTDSPGVGNRQQVFAYPFSALQRVLANPDSAKLLRADIAWQIDKHGGVEGVDIIDSDSHPELVGKSLGDLRREWGYQDPVDIVLKIKEEGDLNRPEGARFRSMQTLSFADVANLARTDWAGSVTDAGVVDLKGGFTQPRYFGAFTEKIELLVKKNHVISLEHAIRAGTGLPASWLSLPDRGLVKEGYKADLQVIDLDNIRVNARWTLTNSRAYSDGVDYVLVNGKFTLHNGTPTYTLAGRSIRNQDVWSNE